MDLIYLAIGIPLVPMIIAIFLPGLVRRYPTIVGSCFFVVMMGGAIALLLAVPGEHEHLLERGWLPAAGIDFALRVTAFTAWFTVLILGLGACIFLYASSYFAKNPRLPYLIATLSLFTTAMIGVVWSDNLYLLFLFWEATSLISFLLIGFGDEVEETREKASQALLVTMAGGAVMLVGFIMLHQHLGTASISGLLALAGEPEVMTLPGAAMMCILLGPLTKSAQWPFHFWLPNAMAGPTPVSAFLHSATMVKAGVFLLASLAPVLSVHPLWTPILATSGILTVATSILRAAREDDMKSILASTTLAALGFLTILAAVGTPAALLGFVVFLTAHALYKAPLFLAVGNLEKKFGTRSLSQLRGAFYMAPWTGVALVISAGSLIGLVPLPGFLGKEYLLKAAWAYSPMLAIAVALSAACVLGLGLKLVIPMLDRRRKLAPGLKLPWAMVVATLVPAIGSLGLMAVLPMANHEFLGSAATALGAQADASYKLWHGWTPALGLGLLALAISVVVWWVLSQPRVAPLPASLELLFDHAFKNCIQAIKQTADGVGKLLEAGKLEAQLAVMLLAVGGLCFFAIDIQQWYVPNYFENQGVGVEWLFAIVVTAAAVMAARARRTQTLLVALGFIGLIIALFFLWFSAPDLALTQLLAETLLLLLLAGVLYKNRAVLAQSKGSIPRFVVASLAGMIVTVLILKSMTLEWNHPISDFHLKHSKSAAFGANAVNVILVDFRALDTLGEIIVLAIAALGATAALGAPRRRSPLPWSSDSRWLATARGLIVWILVPVAIWLFWRGHNEPGGGFIGALVAASAVALGVLTQDRKMSAPWLRRRAHACLVLGLVIALISAALPLMVGKPFFAGLWWHAGDFHLGTPLLFDLGVFVTVLGFALGFMRYFQPNKI